MIRRLAFALALLCAAALLSPPPLAAAPGTDSLTVRVENVRDARGALRIALFDAPDRFATRGGASLRARVPARQGVVEAVFPDLAPGTYALTLWHDADGDGELNRLLGALPTEGWGASNNPGALTRPTWENARFTVPPGGAEVTVRLNY